MSDALTTSVNLRAAMTAKGYETTELPAEFEQAHGECPDLVHGHGVLEPSVRWTVCEQHKALVCWVEVAQS